MSSVGGGGIGATGPTGPAGPAGATGATGAAAWPGDSTKFLAGDGSYIVPVTSTATAVSFPEAIASPTILQATRTTDAAPQNLTIQSQTPFATATGTNRNPGNVVLTVPTPASGGTDGKVSANISGVEASYIDRYRGVFNGDTVASTRMSIAIGSYYVGGNPNASAAGIYVGSSTAAGTPVTAPTSTNFSMYFTNTHHVYNSGSVGFDFRISNTSMLLISPSGASNTLRFGRADADAIFDFTPRGAVASPGNNIRITGQTAGTSGNQNGGRLDLQGGLRSGTGLKGGVRLSLNGSASPEPMVETAEILEGQRVVSLAQGAALTSTQMPSNTGDLVVYLANAGTVPTANPASGSIIYNNAGSITTRTANGVVNDLSPIGVSNASLTNRRWLRQHGSVTTINDTMTTIATLTIPSSSVGVIQAFLVGKRSDSEGNVTSVMTIGHIKRNGAAAPTVTSTFSNAYEDDTNTDWQWTVSGNDVIFQVQGVTSQTWQWDIQLIGDLSAL